MIFDGLVPGSYDLIVADPPWRFRTWSETNQSKSASRHYDLMHTADIETLPVASLAARDSVLLLWGTCAMLPQALACMAAWGFAYKSSIAWRKMTPGGKVRMGTGYWARSMHEPVLIGTRGKPVASAFPSIFDGVAREHSRKPEEFYAMVDKCLPHLTKRADLFARTSRPGWSTWGNETTKFDAGVNIFG